MVKPVSPDKVAVSVSATCGPSSGFPGRLAAKSSTATVTLGAAAFAGAALAGTSFAWAYAEAGPRARIRSSNRDFRATTEFMVGHLAEWTPYGRQRSAAATAARRGAGRAAASPLAM